MKIGLGLPNADKSLTRGRLLIDIARRADELGFSTLATIGRVSYPTYEELVTLAAAAGAGAWWTARRCAVASSRRLNKFVARWPLSLSISANKKTPRASRLGLGVRFFWCLSRLCTTSGPATQAGKGKPEVIKRCATHDRIMPRAL